MTMMVSNTVTAFFALIAAAALLCYSVSTATTSSISSSSLLRGGGGVHGEHFNLDLPWTSDGNNHRGRGGGGGRRDGAVSMGTTLLAARFKGGVVLAADSRTSSGSYVANRYTDKIAHVRGMTMLMRSGSAADTQYLAEQLRAKLEAYELQNRRQPTVKTAATLTKHMAYAHKEALQASMICAGWDSRLGEQIFIVPLGGSIMEESPFAVSGSGSAYIMAYCDANLREDMSKEQCIEICQQALALAMERDGASGGVIRLAIVDSGGVERRVLQPLGEQQFRRIDVGPAVAEK